MLLDDIASKIDGISTSWKVGTNIFKSMMPDSPDTAISIHEYGGAAPQWAFQSSTAGPVFEQPRFQVVARSTSYATARTNAEAVYKALDGIANSTAVSTSGPLYVSLRAVQSPFSIGQDEDGRWRIACNFQARKVRS